MLRPRRVHLLPPVSYQGGKRRQAPEIVRHMALDPDQEFYDLCCGSGAVSLELISRGHNPAKITMVDAGPWGLFWQAVGVGNYNIERLEGMVRELVASPRQGPDVLRQWAGVPCSADDVPVLLPLLQGFNFGRRPVGWADGLWRGISPAPHSTAHNHFGSLPCVILDRIRCVLQHARGVVGICGDAREVTCSGAAYLDPPYGAGSDYLHGMDVAAFIKATAIPVYVSERVPLNATAKEIRGRKTNMVNAKGDRDTLEYLSLFNADWPGPDTERAEQQSLF